MKSGECFLLIGKERLLKIEFIQDLRKKSFKNLSDATMNVQEWDAAEEGSAGAAIDFAQTTPFLGEKRIAVLSQIEELEESGWDKFLSFLKNLPSTAAVVLMSEETGTKKRKFLQELEAVAVVVACHTPFEKDLPGWVEARVRKMGGSINRDAARNLIEHAGKDVSSLQNSIEALLIFIHPRTSITAADIGGLLGKTGEEDIFAVADDLLGKNTKDALEKTETLFREGVRAPEIIGVLAGQLERMKQAAGLLERGASPAEAAAALRVHSFFQQKFFLQLKKANKAAIEKTQKRLLECDTAIKQGRISERVALEKFILEC